MIRIPTTPTRRLPWYGGALALSGWMACTACSSSPASDGGGDAGNDQANAPSGSDAASPSPDGSSPDAPSSSPDAAADAADAADAGGSKAMDGGAAAPAPAAAVGYNLKTFDSTILGTTPGTWQNWSFYGSGAQVANAVTQNADGTLLLTGNENDNYGATVATASQTSTGNKWTGVAFGGGAYFEAVMSFTGQGNGPYANGGPAFWSLDVEHTSQGPYDVTWPGYDAGTYNDFFEVDYMEYDVNEYAYQNGIGNWYGPPGMGLGTSNPYEAVGGAAGSVLVPNTTNFAMPQTYATLWVPATPTTQGYLKFYFNGTQTGQTFVWNYNDPAHPFAPPPVNNMTAMSGMDQRHMFMILGTGTTQPTTVYRVRVWQATAANNLQE